MASARVPANEQPTLYVTPGLALEDTRHYGGAPVWPLRSSAELERFSELARESGLRTATVEIGETTPAPPPEGSGHVVSIGRDPLAAGRCYAHLTGRRHAHCWSLDEFPLINDCEVVITTAEHADERLFERLLYAREPDATPGLLVGTAEELALQLPRAALRAVANPAMSLPSLLFLGNVDIEHQSPECTVLGKSSNPELLSLRLAERWGLLALLSHGDGIDAKLISDRTLCSLPAKTRSTSERAPLCALTGYCHRQSMPADVARRDGRLIDAGSLCARAVVLYTCQGLLHPAGTVSNDWGLARALMNNANVGAVITSSQALLTHPLGIMMLQRLIMDFPLGRAIAIYNESAIARELCHRLNLLGEPRARVQPKTARPDLERTGAVQASLPRLGGAGRAVEVAAGFLPRNLQFLRCLLPEKPEAIDEIGRELLGALDAHAHGLASLRRVRLAALDYALRGGIKSTAGWMWLSEKTEQIDDEVSCFTCGRRCNVVRVRLRLPYPMQRRVTICHRCGMVNDLPLGDALTIELRGNDVHWTSPRPSGDWAAGVFVRPKKSDEHFGLRWPSDANGLPAPSVRLPRPIPAGPVRIYLYLMHEDRLSIAIAAVRGRVAVRADGSSAARDGSEGETFARRSET